MNRGYFSLGAHEKSWTPESLDGRRISFLLKLQTGWLQVVSTVDPFGYYTEGIQQRLDDAFVEGETSSQGIATEHESPSAVERPSLQASSSQAPEGAPPPASEQPVEPPNATGEVLSA